LFLQLPFLDRFREGCIARRDFNAVSHPSQEGKPSVKVSEDDVVEYEAKILKLIANNLLK
jgi:hypothetical protein